MGFKGDGFVIKIEDFVVIVVYWVVDFGCRFGRVRFFMVFVGRVFLIIFGVFVFFFNGIG